MEVISDSSPRKSSGSVCDDDITSSCPCIDHLGQENNILRMESNKSNGNNNCQVTVTTPLLSNHHIVI